MTQSPDDREGIAALTEAAHTLINKIDQLDRGTGSQLLALTKRSKLNRNLLILMAVAGVVTLALTAAVVVGYQRTDDLAHRLDVAQTTQRQKALCPLYGLFLSSRNDKSRAAYPQGAQAYDRAFGIIQDGYDVLECASFIGR